MVSLTGVYSSRAESVCRMSMAGVPAMTCCGSLESTMLCPLCSVSTGRWLSGWGRVETRGVSVGVPSCRRRKMPAVAATSTTAAYCTIRRYSRRACSRFCTRAKAFTASVCAHRPLQRARSTVRPISRKASCRSGRSASHSLNRFLSSGAKFPER